MAEIKFITPKESNLFLGSVVFSVKDKYCPMQLKKIKDGKEKKYFLVDINSGDILRAKLWELLILSIEDNGKYYPVKYCGIGKALKLFEERVTKITFKTTTLENNHVAALI